MLIIIFPSYYYLNIMKIMITLSLSPAISLPPAAFFPEILIHNYFYTNSIYMKTAQTIENESVSDII